MQEIAKNLLQDPETICFLETAVLEKADRYDELKNFINSNPDSKIDDFLSGYDIENGVRLFFARCEVEIERKRLEIDLANICYALKSVENNANKPTDWERTYEHATRIVTIERVVSFLLGIDCFNRNIRCPFHEDNKASMKIYVKDNYFVCFGCGVRGSPINFVMQYKNCSFKEAVLFLSIL